MMGLENHPYLIEGRVVLQRPYGQRRPHARMVRLILEVYQRTNLTWQENNVRLRQDTRKSSEGTQRSHSDACVP